MRIVYKINLALAAAVAASALLNYGALHLTVMPSFLALESQSAERNQSRALEAIELEKDQVANSSGDYAFWDDTYEFMTGGQPDYVEKNVNPESLQTLGINYFALIDATGKVVLDAGYDFSRDEATPAQLFGRPAVASDDVFTEAAKGSDPASGLIQTTLGLATGGYAPVLRSDRSGPAVGTLVFGRLVDLDQLKTATKVNFDIVPVDQGVSGQTSDVAIDLSTRLLDVRGQPIGQLVSHTTRDVSAAGRNAIWAALGLLIVGGVLLIGVLAMIINWIAVRRIEKMRAHLMAVGQTGDLVPMAEDTAGDELSEALASFNVMAAQLSELRDKLRRKDYEHGAAEQAAGLLHNVRNAMSPIATIAWELAQVDTNSGRQNLGKALQQLSQPELEPQRAAKLNQFVALTATQLLEEDDARRQDLTAMADMIRHVEDILKEFDADADASPPSEMLDLRSCVKHAADMVSRRAEVTLELADRGAHVMAPKTTVEQLLANLVVNAAEAIEATGKEGRIKIGVKPCELGGAPAFDVSVSDTGEGIAPDLLETMFQRGFSTRPSQSRGLGLHWCANAANAMGGRLFAESGGIGQGATLHLILPVVQAALEGAA